MFCSDCGKEIPAESKFCPGCGKATGSTQNVTNAASDPAKILKEGEFRRVEQTMDAMSKKNDGKLTLFCDRIEWKGRINCDIKIDDIAKVGVVSNGYDPYLEITDSTGKTLKYFRPRNLTTALAGAGGMALGQQLNALNATGNLTEMESWHSAIDKLRGRL
jgi:hypothetical protein